MCHFHVAFTPRFVIWYEEEVNYCSQFLAVEKRSMDATERADFKVDKSWGIIRHRDLQATVNPGNFTVSQTKR
jgi:hypothetical protein